MPFTWPRLLRGLADGTAERACYFWSELSQVPLRRIFIRHMSKVVGTFHVPFTWPRLLRGLADGTAERACYFGRNFHKFRYGLTSY